MKRRPRITFIHLALLVVFSATSGACGGSGSTPTAPTTPTTPTPPVSSPIDPITGKTACGDSVINGTMTALINDAPFTPNFLVVAAVTSPAFSLSFWYCGTPTWIMTIEGANLAQKPATVSMTAVLLYAGLPGPGYWTSALPGGSGTITFTRWDAAGVAGTLSFVATAGRDSTITQTQRVTNASFDIALPH